MRLAAQAKLGFYPAHPDAIAAILTHLRMPEDAEKAAKVHILDPCAGEGEAIGQIAEGLGVPGARTYAIELDGGRGEKARERLGPAARVLSPASYMGSRVTGQSMGLVYCNPPFDNELGGGKRQEQTFAQHSTGSVKAGGVLVLVMPTTAIENNYRFWSYLDTTYDDAALYAFPDSCRPFKEVVYIAKRRRAEIPDRGEGFLATTFDYRNRYRPLPVIGEGGRTWTIPPTYAPNTFVKRELTELEMVAAVEGSPLLARLKPPAPQGIPRPPLPLSNGHIALLLASGLLDGVVAPPGEQPHVVRGTSRKVTFLAESTTTENENTGTTTHKEVWSQRIVLTVRAVMADGTIKTFEDEKKAEPASNPVPNAEADK